MDKHISPPAIVKQDQSTLEQLAFEINAAHEAGEQATKKGLERFKEAGDALIKAKSACQHGTWLDWLKKNVKVDRRTASNYMKLASKWETVSHLKGLREALTIITADEDEPAAPPSTQVQPAPRMGPAPAPSPQVVPTTKMCKDCRHNSPKKNCKDCAALNNKGTLPETEEARDLEKEAKEKAAADKKALKEVNDAKKESGKEVVSWPEWKRAMSVHAQALDRIGDVYKCKESTEVQGIRRLLNEYLAAVAKLWKDKTGEEMPR